MAEQLDFKISTGLKDIIGKELITDDQIAIFELVKNSYDAKARNVAIVFQNIKNSQAGKPQKIIIIDNGYGMSLEDIKNKWLFVGFSEKKIPDDYEKNANFRNKIRKHGRFFAGAKGIGRFSADRLGQKLGLYTKKKSEDLIHSLNMDWKKFEGNQEEEFQTIKVNYSTTKKIPIQGIPLKSFEHGTILEITSLNETWNMEKLLRLRKYLQRLVNPSQDPNNQDFKIELIAEEFEEEDKKSEPHEIVNGPVKNVVFEKLGIKTTHINCSIKDGEITTELVDKGKYVFRLKEDNGYHLLDNIAVHAFFLNRDAKDAFSRIMGMQPVQYGTIFLYKNGFRIHPYGDEGDDWLGLDKRKGQGFARFLGSREVMGRIEVYGVQQGFREVSSRSEGAVKTKALEQLKKFFVEKVLRRLEKYVVEGINWDTDDLEKKKSPEEIKRDSLKLVDKIVGQVKDPQKNIDFNPELLGILKDREMEKIPELIKNVESLKRYVKSPKVKKYIEKQLRSVRNATRTLAKEKSHAEQELQVKKHQVIFLEKSLSIDDKIAQDLNHSIVISSDTIKGIIEEITQKIRDGSSTQSLLPFIEQISFENQKVASAAAIVTNANFDLQVNKHTKDLVQYIKQYVERVLVKTSEGIEYSFQNTELAFEKEFVPLEISMMMDNFISNSIKAGASVIKFRFEVKDKTLHVYIGDNGKGVEAKNERFLFTRGFTTTTGSGIGLQHIKRIAESMDGDVEFIGNNFKGLGKGACFEVTVR